MATTEVTAISNCMNPRILSDGNKLRISKSAGGKVVAPARIPPPHTAGGDVAAPAKIPSPLNQFFERSQLGSSLMTLVGGAFVAVLGFQASSIRLPHVVPILVLLGFSFSLLFVGLLFQETFPSFAVGAVLFGVAFCVGAFLTMFASVLAPTHNDLILGSIASPILAVLPVLFWATRPSLAKQD